MLTDKAEASDHTIEEEGATVFVAATAAEFLDDKVLDASLQADGVRFTIREPRAGAPGDAEQPG
jgi:Fe-S cluster assembly iron-binding protein IscA